MIVYGKRKIDVQKLADQIELMKTVTRDKRSKMTDLVQLAYSELEKDWKKEGK